MVGTWGMSEEIGAVYLGTGEEHIFLGREITQDKAFSDATSERLDRAVREMVDSALVQATETIAMHKQDLERLVSFLLEKETVDSEDVIAILGPPLRSASDTVITAEEAEAIIESAEAPVDDAAPAPIES
jgi:cell division protease FtsH